MLKQEDKFILIFIFSLNRKKILKQQFKIDQSYTC